VIALIETVFVALTDAQFDKVLILIEHGFKALSQGVQAVFNVLLPVLLAWVAWQCQKITHNQKSNRAALDQNTALTETAINTSNGYNEKIAASLKEIADLKRQLDELKK
jgi:hypothetical protein